MCAERHMTVDLSRPAFPGRDQQLSACQTVSLVVMGLRLRPVCGGARCLCGGRTFSLVQNKGRKKG